MQCYIFIKFTCFKWLLILSIHQFLGLQSVNVAYTYMFLSLFHFISFHTQLLTIAFLYDVSDQTWMTNWPLKLFNHTHTHIRLSIETLSVYLFHFNHIFDFVFFSKQIEFYPLSRTRTLAYTRLRVLSMKEGKDEREREKERFTKRVKSCSPVYFLR